METVPRHKEFRPQQLVALKMCQSVEPGQLATLDSAVKGRACGSPGEKTLHLAGRGWVTREDFFFAFFVSLLFLCVCLFVCLVGCLVVRLSVMWVGAFQVCFS